MEVGEYLDLKFESTNKLDKYYTVYNKGVTLGRIVIKFLGKGVPSEIGMAYNAHVDGGGDMQGAAVDWRNLALDKNKSYVNLTELLSDLEQNRIKTALLMETEEKGAW